MFDQTATRRRHLDELEAGGVQETATVAPTTQRSSCTGPASDRPIVYLPSSTGLRREELVTLDLDQVRSNIPTSLRKVRGGSL